MPAVPIKTKFAVIYLQIETVLFVTQISLGASHN
jgi:hypothetical protein